MVESALTKQLSDRPADGGALLELLAAASVEEEITRGWRSLKL